MSEMLQADYLPVSPKTRQICERLANEARRGVGRRLEDIFRPDDCDAVDFSDYKNGCREILGRDFGRKLLTPKLLQDQLDYIMSRDESDLKLHYPEDSFCFPAIIPFTIMGNPVDPEEIQNGDFLSHVAIGTEGRSKGKTLRGFGVGASYVGDMLPDAIRGTGFHVGQYERDADDNLTPGFREKIAAQYAEAYRRLQVVMDVEN